MKNSKFKKILSIILALVYTQRESLKGFIFLPQNRNVTQTYRNCISN